MDIIEQHIVGKNPKRKSEDGIVVTKDYIAVIDGSTSKTDRRFSLFRSNGCYCMQLIERYIRKAKGNLSCQQFCNGVTHAVARHYKKADWSRLAAHPEERLTASAIVYSRLNREIWMIGDCQCLIGGEYYDNPKPYEAELAAMRAQEVERLLNEGHTVDELCRNDIARHVIIPRMIETMRQQNITYSVVDGFPISRHHVRTITLDFQPYEIILASDGYPFLHPTLEESEAALQRQRQHDPLNYSPDFQATKAFHPDFNSFDDRTYIRFRV